ncbi:MAG: phosphorylase [Steroidobacteraceae bacterium]|nr:phosphorylase [Deltaproteobacteria bacterium]
MNIAIIVAMPEEFRAVANCLGTVAARRLGKLKAGRCSIAGHQILLVESGMGFKNAAGAAEMVIRDRAPDLLISAGFCGGIAAELRVGDVVVAKKMVIVSETGIEDLPTAIPAAGLNFVVRQSACGARVFGGTFAGTAVITSKAKLVGMLSNGCPCPVVEMESAAIALVAAENGIPLIAIRSVSDPVDEELGFSLDEFCDNSLRIRPGRVLLTILRKPRIIPQLVRLAGNSRIAAKSLTAALEKLLPLL